ncbi:dihydrofolate reductase family protein [Leifsonia sp. F6_8S_P_1B]|uniref:Dihydrofolate reductase family protein n=1 Tax=Leifsonia williamsii TaxID=3035919 RepID=A0ABT8K630_9MICO|nr:dihydrofolate reductase family protein [Leifsonia williamsii]MDN4612909.1 dihydrofolate reductase family protein [Leifsonia williamsii]
MPRLIVTQFMTLDGVVEAPGGETTHRHSGWTMPYGTDDLVAFKLREVQEAGSLLLGRRTYEQFAEAWPPREGPFADAMNALPKTVVTSRAGELGWNATALVADRQLGGVRAAVQGLKEQEGDAPILVPGSASLVRSLLVWGLVDELRLLTYPVLVGGGVRIFPDDREKWAFELTTLDRFESGAVLHIYRLAGS